MIRMSLYLHLYLWAQPSEEEVRIMKYYCTIWIVWISNYVWTSLIFFQHCHFQSSIHIIQKAITYSYSSFSDRSCISDIELPPPPPMLGEQMSASSCRSVHAEILESVSKIKCSLLGRKGGLLHHYGNSYGSEVALNTLLGGHGG